MAITGLENFPKRRDLIDEIAAVFNSNGNYVSGYYDSSGINSIRVAAYNMTGTSIQFVVWDYQFSPTGGNPQAVRSQKLAVDTSTNSVYAQVNLTGRVFLITVENGTPGSELTFTIRAVL